MDFLKVAGSLFLGIIIWGIVLIALLVALVKRQKLGAYFREVITELQKATWPWDPKEKTFAAKYKELIDSTLVVIIAMILLGACVSTIDFGLLGILDQIFQPIHK
jgi:preprotein translocase subunit SecE